MDDSDDSDNDGPEIEPETEPDSDTELGVEPESELVDCSETDSEPFVLTLSDRLPLSELLPLADSETEDTDSEGTDLDVEPENELVDCSETDSEPLELRLSDMITGWLPLLSDADNSETEPLDAWLTNWLLDSELSDWLLSDSELLLSLWLLELSELLEEGQPIGLVSTVIVPTHPPGNSTS